MSITSIQFKNMADDRRKQWYAHFLKFVVLFISALAVLSLFRAFFLFYFSKGIDAVNASSALPALWMGLRVDAKWLSLSLVPAYLILLLAYWKPFFTSIPLSLPVLDLPVWCYWMLSISDFSASIKHRLAPWSSAFYKMTPRQFCRLFGMIGPSSVICSFCSPALRLLCLSLPSPLTALRPIPKLSPLLCWE